MTEELRLSVSKTKTFIDCKAKYKFCYIQKLPRKEWDYHVFGKFCHRVLEWFHLQYIEGCLLPYNTTMTDAFKVAWEEFKDKMTPEMKKECWEIIDQYLRLITKEKKDGLAPQILSVEKRFDFHISENIVLNGAIDRIQLDADNIIHVSDYKTTKNKKYLKNDFFQLLTYAYVLLQEDPTLKKIRASYILLRHKFEYITIEFDVPSILAVKDQYLKYAEKMLEEKDFTPNPTILCRYCDYSDVCIEGKKMLEPSKIYGEVSW